MKRSDMSLIGNAETFCFSSQSLAEQGEELKPSLLLCMTSAAATFPIRDCILDHLCGELVKQADISAAMSRLRTVCRRFAADRAFLSRSTAYFRPLQTYSRERPRSNAKVCNSPLIGAVRKVVARFGPYRYYMCSMRRACASDLRALSFAKRLHLLGVNNTDLSVLSSVPSIYFAGCTQLENVSPFANCAGRLRFDVCRQLRDVSPLAHVPELYFSGLPRLIDVSALAHVRKLTLRLCENLVDVSRLSHVHELSISECARVVDVSGLANVHTLCLDALPLVTDISALCDVPVLTISKCWGITNILTPMRNEELTLWRLPLERIDGLSSVQRSVDLCEINSLSNFAPLCKVPHVSICFCKSLVDLSSLRTVQSLELRNCYNILDWSPLQSVRNLVVEDC